MAPLTYIAHGWNYVYELNLIILITWLKFEIKLIHIHSSIHVLYMSMGPFISMLNVEIDHIN
jgi:hypothetical protein